MAKFNPLDYLKQATTKPQAQAGYTPVNAPMSKGTPVGPSQPRINSGGGISSGPNQNYSPMQPPQPQPPMMPQGQAQQPQVMQSQPMQPPPSGAVASGPNQNFNPVNPQPQAPVQGQQPLSGNFDANGNPLYSAQGSQAFTDVNTALMGLGAVALAPAAAVAFPALAPAAAAALTTQYNKVTSYFQSLGKLGQTALSPGGPDAIAQTTINNPSFTRQAVQFLQNIALTKLPPSRTLAGFIVRAGIVAPPAAILYNYKDEDNAINKQTDQIELAEKTKLEMLAAGDYAGADAINQQLQELADGLEEFNNLNPTTSIFRNKFLAESEQKIKGYVNAWNNQKLINQVKATTAIVEDQKVRTADEAQLIQSISGMSDEEIINNMEILTFLADPLNQGSTLEKLYYGAYNRYYSQQQEAEQRQYDESQTAEQRAYNENQEQSQRAYNESQARANQEVYSPSSTLNIGLLHTPGGAESVGTGGGGATTGSADTTGTAATGTSDTGTTAQQPDKDAIALYLFQKHYVELAPEQKMVVDKW